MSRRSAGPTGAAHAGLVLASLALLVGPVLMANGGRAGPAGVAAGAALILAGAGFVVGVFRRRRTGPGDA